MNRKTRPAPSASNRTTHEHPKEALSLLGWLAIVTRNGRWTPKDTLLGVRVRPEGPTATVYDVKMFGRGPRVMGGPVLTFDRAAEAELRGAPAEDHPAAEPQGP